MEMNIIHDLHVSFVMKYLQNQSIRSSKLYWHIEIKPANLKGGFEIISKDY